VAQLAVAATNRNAVVGAAHIESSDDACARLGLVMWNFVKFVTLQRQLFWSVAATANWVASQPPCWDETGKLSSIDLDKGLTNSPVT